MSDAYVGEIRIFGGPYAPNNWHFCDGSILPIKNYMALYTLIGVTYGGDQRTTFGLPDLRGRLPVGQGQGPNLTARAMGQKAGSSAVTINEIQLPVHSHDFHASSGAATTATLANGVGLAATKGGVVAYAPNSLVTVNQVVRMGVTSIGYSPNGGQSHPNLMPYLAVNYIICLDGLFPTFN